jgi:hypothetical protein
MRALYQIAKYPDSPVTFPIDANPWLETIASTFQSATIGDAAGIVETSTIANGVVTLKLDGGSPGQTYRVPVTVTAASGVTRATIVEVSVIGLAPPGTGGGGGGAANVVDSLTGNSSTDAPSVRAVNAALSGVHPGVIDGGIADSTYGGGTAIDAGSA